MKGHSGSMLTTSGYTLSDSYVCGVQIRIKPNETGSLEYAHSMQRTFFSPKLVRPSSHTSSCECVKIKMLTAVTKLCRQITSWTTDLKITTNTHHGCGSNIGWVSPGLIFFSLSCVYICKCPVPAKPPYQMKPTSGW